MTVKRAFFSSTNPAEIQRAIRNLGLPNKNQSEAVDARIEIDLRIGAAFTRFQTLRIQRRFGVDGIVSYGPCQFPTLGFVVDRWKRREAFLPESFWSITVTVSLENETTSPRDDDSDVIMKDVQKFCYFFVL